MAAYFTAPRTCRYLKLPPQMVLACGTNKLSLVIPVSFKNFLWCFFSNNFFNPGRRIFTSGGLCRLFPSPLDIECYISWLLCWVLRTLPSLPPWPYWAGHVMADPTGIALLYPQEAFIHPLPWQTDCNRATAFTLWLYFKSKWSASPLSFRSTLFSVCFDLHSNESGS